MFAMLQEIARQHTDDLLREAEVARLIRATQQPRHRFRKPRKLSGKPRTALAGR